jgi:hypothetical protein
MVFGSIINYKIANSSADEMKIARALHLLRTLRRLSTNRHKCFHDRLDRGDSDIPTIQICKHSFGRASH